jgi:hypothetical protein
MLTSGAPRSTATRMYAAGDDETGLDPPWNSLVSHDLVSRCATRPSDMVIAPPGTLVIGVALDDGSNRTLMGSTPVAPDESVATERPGLGGFGWLAPARG